MLDSLVRKLTKISKHNHNQHHLSYCSTASSISSSLSSPIDLNRHCVSLELFELNDSCIQTKPSVLAEHIYEEIQENQQFNNNNNNPQIIMLREDLINETLPPSSTSSLSSNKSSSSSSACSSASSSFSSKKKKSVRFNSNFSCDEVKTINSGQCQLVLCSKCANCLNQQHTQLNHNTNFNR